ncbi:MAG: toll/interleukin-1 receptor domain-containing protein [Thermoanaerobaculia bacterium]
MDSGIREKVFISYSKEDQKWLDRLLTLLAPKPERIWWDGRIKAGQKWLDEIQTALNSAKIAVFLVSPNFLATEFILKVELPQLLAAGTEGVAVLWSLVRNCPWEDSPLASYQAVRYQKTHDMKAWNALSEAELDDLLKDFAKEIEVNLRSDLAVREAVPAPKPAAVEESGVFDPTKAGRVQEGSSMSSRVESAYAKELLQDIDDPKTVDEIGSLFVLRKSWSAAEVAYDYMVELAAPHQELWMAWGYEKLGLIHEQQSKWKHVYECLRLAQILYRRLGRVEQATELGLRLQKIEVLRGMASA